MQRQVCAKHVPQTLSSSSIAAGVFVPQSSSRWRSSWLKSLKGWMLDPTQPVLELSTMQAVSKMRYRHKVICPYCLLYHLIWKIQADVVIIIFRCPWRLIAPKLDWLRLWPRSNLCPPEQWLVCPSSLRRTWPSVRQRALANLPISARLGSYFTTV